MRLLLDTHVFLWWDAKDARLSEPFRAAITSPQNDVFVSAATVWEIAIKRALGKLRFGGSATTAILRHNFHALAITPEHAEWAGSLDELHSDPFDRMLVSQAQHEGMILVTVDAKLLQYQVPHL